MARSVNGAFYQYAIKFCYRRSDYETEAALYAHPTIRHTLPPLIQASDNANGAVVSPSGYVYSPFIVMERGATLTECAPCLVLLWLLPCSPCAVNWRSGHADAIAAPTY